MNWTTKGIDILGVYCAEPGLVVTAGTTHDDRVIQAYVGGELADWQWPRRRQVRFHLPKPDPADGVLLLAVTPVDATRNYWQEARGGGDVSSRLSVALKRSILDAREIDEAWRVFLGPVGAGAAADLVHQAPVFPQGKGACGWGLDFGRGGWGYGGSGAPGWGVEWAHVWAYGRDFLTFTTDTLTRGVWPMRVETEDAHGNASTAFETFAYIDTYPRGADDLAVAAFARGTDTLTLTFTPSEDL